jgi:cytoskeletal protein CcmA (bactofilin family)
MFNRHPPVLSNKQNMFGNNNKSTEDNKKPVTSSGSTSSGGINTLTKGTVVEGTLRCDNDIRVDGIIKGKLNCQAKVIIGPSGVIEGEVRCQNAVIEGKLHGTLVVSDLLNVRETADIDGDITTNKLTVQSGAKFNVACKMETGLSNGAAKPTDAKANSQAGQIAGGKTEVRN